MAYSTPTELVEIPYFRDGYIELDRTGGIARWNRRMFEIYGISAADTDACLALPPTEWQRRFADLVLPLVADEQTFLAALRRHLAVSSEYSFDETPMKSGRVVERYGEPIRDASGAVIGRAAYHRDVTQRRREVEALRDQATRSAAVADLGELALLAEDLEALERVTVRVVERTLGADLVQYLALDPAEDVLRLRHTSSQTGNVGPAPIRLDAGSFSGFAFASGGSVVSCDLEAESRFVAPRLRSVGVRSGVACMVRGRERPHGILGAFWRRPRSFTPEETRFLETTANVLAAALTRHDAEQRLLQREREAREMQSRLALADRMASVGTLAAGVAHELNNPLSYVVANLSFLGGAMEKLARCPGLDRELHGELTDALREAREGSERMRGIIRDLKTFSRGDDNRSGPVELRTVLESCVSIAWNEIRHRAQFVRELADVPPVRGSEGKLGQVFLNLLVNAAQAIPEGSADRNEIRLVTRSWPDGRVAVEVRDTGCGIPEEARRRIFDPFYTTKPVGEGTGLGLTICHNIVAAAGGDIEVESVEGRGSTFRVLLPAAAAPGAPPGEAATPPGAAGARPAARRGRVLVVDDEPLVGAAVRRTLAPDHDVVVVAGARQALERLRREAFDIVVTDLLMPEVTGMELYAELEARFPALAARTVFVTGGAFTAATRAFVEAHQDRCLEKPFEAAALRDLVRRWSGA